LFTSIAWDYGSATKPSLQAVGTQQRLRLRRTPAERDETFQRRTAGAYAQEFIAEARARRRIDHAALFERTEHVGRQHFGPQIAVITGCITAREDMRERVRETLPRGGMQHRGFAPRGFQGFHHPCAARRIV